MINFFIGTLVQIYKFTKKDESRTVSGGDSSHVPVFGGRINR